VKLTSALGSSTAIIALLAFTPAQAQCPPGYWCRQQVEQQMQDQADAQVRAEAEAVARAAEERRQAAPAKRAEVEAERAQAAADAEAERQAAIQEELDKRKAAAEANAEAAAENSPDNDCKKPEVAEQLLEQFNNMPWQMESALYGAKAIDIHHLVTIKHDPVANIIVCHGTWELTVGGTTEGTLTMKPNVAGQMISEWRQEHWQPPIPEIAIPQLPPVVPIAAPAATAPNPPPAPSDSFHRGLADRQDWETWVAGLTGDYQRGVFYWASQRSLPHPGSCSALGGQAAAGCSEAMQKLRLSDVLRKADPDYRRGWNSYQLPSVAQTTPN